MHVSLFFLQCHCPIKIDATVLDDVDEFLKATKAEVKPLLDAVPLPNLQLFQAEEVNLAPLEPDTKVDAIAEGNSAKTPLYVHYPEPEAQTHAGHSTNITSPAARNPCEQ